MALVVFGTVGVADAQDADELVVVTTEIEPYVVRNGEVAEGFYFEIWEHVAGELGLDFEVVWVDSLPEMAEMLSSGEADVGVAPLSTTEDREGSFDFTETVLASGPQLGAHERLESPVTLLSALFSSDILEVLFWGLVALLLLGNLMWWVERKNPDSDFRPAYRDGVGDGMWWAAVTVTTVGYGDTAPKSGRGRVVGVFAMLTGLFLVGAFVSQTTSALQTSRAETVVETPDDVSGERVAAVAGSSYAVFLAEKGAEVVEFDGQAEVFDAAEDGVVDIVVADPYAMAAAGADHGVRAPDDVLYDDFVAFGLQQDSPLREDMNGAITQLHREGRIREIIDRWLD